MSEHATMHCMNFLMVLMRLWLNLLEVDLLIRFNVSVSSVSRTLMTRIIFRNQQLRPLITFSSHTVIERHMPPRFKAKYPDMCIIIDCTEIFTEPLSEKEIMRQSGLLDLLEPGDAVMEDKGFDVCDELVLRGVY